MQGNDRIISEFAADPEMAELVDMFVGDLPQRVSKLEHLIDEHDIEGLRTLAHQLKGAAPGYGFPSIGAAAEAVESAVREAEPSTDIQALRSEADRLIEVCRRAMFPT